MNVGKDEKCELKRCDIFQPKFSWNNTLQAFVNQPHHKERIPTKHKNEANFNRKLEICCRMIILYLYREISFTMLDEET